MSETKRPKRSYKKRGSSKADDQDSQANEYHSQPVRQPTAPTADAEILRSFQNMLSVVRSLGYEIVKR